MRVGLIQVDARTSTGTTDLTVSGYGTCKGAILWITRATTNGTAADEAVLGYGATDGTNDRCCSTASQHNQADTNTWKRAKTGKCVMLLNPSDGSIDGEAEFDAFITDGIRIDTTNAFASAYKINALLFYGDDCSVYVGDFDTTAGDDVVTEPGFEPDIVCVFGTRAAINDTSTANAGFSLGFATWDGSDILQDCVNWGEDDAATVGSPYVRVATNVIARNLQNTTLLGVTALESFGSSGFTAAQRATPGFPMCYVAIKCDNVVDWSLLQVPNATGPESYTYPNFRPGLVAGFLTRQRNADNTNTAVIAGSIGVFAFTSDTNEFSASIQTADNVATTNTQSVCDDIAFLLPTDAGATNIVGEVTGITSTGFDADFSSVDANFRLFGALFVQELVNTAVTISAGAATVAITTQMRRNTSPTVQASVATVTPDVDVIRRTVTFAPSAGAATTSAPTQRISQHRQSFCAEFDGNSTYLFSDVRDDWTFESAFEFWFLVEDPDEGNGLYGVWTASGNPADCSVIVYMKGGTLRLDYVDGQDLAVYSHDTLFTPTAGRWHQVVVEIVGAADAIALVVSRDGVPDVFRFQVPLPVGFFTNKPNPMEFYLGVDPTSGAVLRGRMMKVRNYFASFVTFDVANLHTLYKWGAGLETDRGASLILEAPFGSVVAAAMELDEYSSGVTPVDRAVQHAFGAASTFATDNGVASGVRGWWLGNPHATAVIDADKITQTTVTVSAGAATTAISGQKRMHVTLALSAGAASPVLDVDVIRQTVTFAVAADAATAAIDADRVVYTTVALSQDAATVAIDADKISQASVTVSAGAATTAIVAQLVHQTTVTCAADAATVAIDVDALRQTTVTVNATDATTAIAAQRIVQTTVTASADAATTVIDGEVDAGAVITTTLTISAGAATTLFDADVIRQTSVTVSADAASAAIAGQRVSQSSVAVSAGAATTIVPTQLVHQTTVTVNAGAATTDISAEVVGTISADVTVSAGAATTAIDAQRIVQTAVACAAGAATTAVTTQRLPQTSTAVSAGAATVTIAGQVFQVTGSVTATAGAATTALVAQRLSQAALALQAGSAASAIDADRIIQAAVSVSAGAATTALDADRVVQTSAALQAGAATAAASGTVIQVQGSAALQAGAATAVITGQVIRQAAVTVQAGAGAAAVAGQRVSQTSMAVTCDPATVVITAGLNITCDLALTQAPATVIVLAQRIVQTTVAVQASPARAQALEVVVPSMLEAPAVVFEMRARYDVIVPETIATIETDEFERTVVAPDLFASLFFNANNKLVATGVAVSASPATVSISGVVL